MQLRPIGEQNWRMFAPLADAQVGLEMIRSVVPNAEMKDATEGQYSQFVYFYENPDIRARVVTGTVEAYGQTLRIEEYPSDIFDRYYQPQFFIDKYALGQPHSLQVGVAASGIGQLYWSSSVVG